MSDNKRVSQLVEITAAEVAQNDLFYIVDTSAREGKKIQANQVGIYLSASGSIFAFHAQLADTASYVRGTNVDGAVFSASRADIAGFATSASHALISDSVISASYSQTASWAINAINGGTQLITGSAYPITASWAQSSTLSQTSSFLLYTGVNNGTASYVISSSHANRADIADTASFFVTHVDSVDTASYAFTSITAQTADSATSASFLVFSLNNGTASYALAAGRATTAGLINYGMFLALEQSASFASIDQLRVEATTGDAKTTTIQALGTAILAYTASVANAGDVTLLVTDRFTGQTQSLDTSEISYNVSSIVNNWNSLSTGSLKTTFDLVGQTDLFGDYLLEVTSSSPYVTFDGNRTVRFLVSSFSDVVTATTAELIDFFIFPTASLISGSANISFSVVSNPTVTYYDSLPGLLITGSQNIKTIDIAGQGINDIKYTWKCTNLTDFSCSNNSVSSLNYAFPATMSHLYCTNCGLITIVDLSNTELVRLECQNNFLNVLPALPDSMSYLNCSNNLLATITSLPLLLQTVNADSNSLASVFVFPNDLLTASFNFNPPLTTLPTFPDSLKKLSVNNNASFTALPVSLSLSMSYLDVSYTNMSILPTMSLSMSYLNIAFSALSQTQVLEATNELLSNATPSGTFIGIGLGAPSVPIYNNLALLSSSLLWSISYDSFP